MGLPDNCIPEDKLPQCWSDDVRMNALFAPFRPKSANPESWNMKMKFWSDMLRQWCRCKRDPVISAADAKFAFQRNGRTPACIDIIVEEMYNSGELAPISKYQQILHNGPEGWVRWGARLAFKPAVFALSAVSSFLPGKQQLDNLGLPKASIDSTQRFVVESVVKDQATELLDNFPPGVERIGTIDELMTTCNWSGSKELFEVLLGYLVSQGSAVKKDDIVKLADTNNKVTPISEWDQSLCQLSCAERRLSRACARAARDSVAARGDARAALAVGDRAGAKSHLRRSHVAQTRGERTESALENVRGMLQQMRDVKLNADIVHTYKTTSDAMKRNMEETGLSEDAVHDTMDDLKEVMENYSEVEKALSNTVEDFDADELEQELKELLSTGPVPSSGIAAEKEAKSPVKETVKDEAPPLPSPPRAVPIPVWTPQWTPTPPPSPPRSPPRSLRRSPPREPRRSVRDSMREFEFDGEARVLAELYALGDSPRGKPVAVKVQTPKPRSQPWYPNSGWTDEEVRQDDRLHPGQPLIVDFTSPPKLYASDFEVRDHKRAGGVWMYNRDDELRSSTEYSSPETPASSGGGFQMAPGGERRKTKNQETNIWSTEDPAVVDLETRLKNLRGFNL